jgi:uncharacterized membrane protein
MKSWLCKLLGLVCLMQKGFFEMVFDMSSQRALEKFLSSFVLAMGLANFFLGVY